jgi:large subunit ribosomal protein L25
MDKVTLKAEARQPGRHSNREIRNAAGVPGVIYGQHAEAQAVSLDRKTLGQALHKASGGVIAMELVDQPTLHVLVREVQRHPTKHNILHIDFLAVSMTEKVKVHVMVVPEGIAPVMGSSDMVLMRQLDHVEVECLPGDIPEHLVADLSKLETVDDEIMVKDLKVPVGVTMLTSGSHVLFAVTLSRAAAEEEVAEEVETLSPSPDEVEVVTKRKPKEEDEPEKK